MTQEQSASVKGFNKSHLTDNTFKSILSGIDPNASLESWSNFELSKGMGLISDASKYGLSEERVVGLHAFELKYKLEGKTDVQSKIVVLKSKPTGQEVGSCFNKLSTGLEGPGLSDAWYEYVSKNGFFETDRKELFLVQTKDQFLNSIMPDIYWVFIDEPEGVFVFAMEYFDREVFTHVDSFLDPKIWTENTILDVLQNIACMHARYYDQISGIPENLRSSMTIMGKEYMMQLQPILRNMFKINKPYCLDSIWSSEDYDVIEKIVTNMESIADILEAAPKTLIHNDFNIRNLCLRKQETSEKLKLCLYDWEFVAIGSPQQDVAECLTYFLTHESTLSEWDFFIEKYHHYFKTQLERRNADADCSLNKYLEVEHFKQIFDMSMMILAVQKHGATVSIMERKIGFPHTKLFCQRGMNYIKKVMCKYSFLK